MKIKALKKSISLILTLAMVLSASYAISNFSAYATERKNYIIGGDFEDGENSLQYYEYTASSKNPIEIVEYQFDNGSATNKAAKLARPASGGDEYGNALSYNLKKLNLKPGAYTLTFDADVTSSNGNSYAFYYGVYNGTYDYSGRFYTNNAPATNKNIVTTAAGKTLIARSEGSLQGRFAASDNEKDGFRISLTNTVDKTVKAKIFLEFNVDGTEDNLYFSAGSMGGTTAYIDNIVLNGSDTVEDGVLVTPNSDFEKGNLSGFTSGANVRVVNSAVNDGDDTTFTGYAAYLPPRTAADTSNITYQMTAVPAGKYTVSFDLDAFAGANPNTNGNMLVGLYKGKPGSYNRGMGNTVLTKLCVYDKKTNAVAANIDYRNDGSAIDFTNAANSYGNYKFTATFTLTEETDMFLGVCFYNNQSDYAYLDNIKFVVADTEQLIENGDFELGGLYGYEYATAIDTPVKVEKHVFDDGNENNYAAKLERTLETNVADNDKWKYPAGRALNKKLEGLEKGNYTLSFDIDATASSTNALYYGIYKGTPNNYGRMFDSCEQISVTSAEKTLNARTTDGLNGVFAARDADFSGNISYRLSFGDSEKSVKAKIMLNFTIDGTEDNLYFSLCVNNGTTAYIDNIKLYSVKFEQYFNNADYAHLAFKNAPFTGVDKIGYAIFVNNTDTTDISTEYFNSSAIGTVSYLRATENGVYYCDVNNDLTADTADIATLRKVLLGIDTSYNKAAANVNGDETVDIRDLVKIKKAFSEEKIENISAVSGSYNYIFKLGLKENDTLQVVPYIISGGERITGNALGMKYSGGKLEEAEVESLSYDFADGTAADAAYIGEYK